MRTRIFAGIAVGAIAAVSLLAPASAATAGNAALSVLHGIPDTPVDVYVNGELTLDDFQPGDLAGPLDLPAGDYEVALTAPDATDAGDPVLGPVTLTLEADTNYTAVAHLDEAGAPTVTPYVNDTSPTAAGEGRLTVRHDAAAPAVDVLAGGARASAPGNYGIFQGVHQGAQVAAIFAARVLDQARHVGVHHIAVLIEELLPFRQDRIQLLVAFLDDVDMAHVGHHRQQRVNGARAGRVTAAGQRFQFLDDFVAVAGLLGDQLQDNEAQVAVIEEATHAATELAAEVVMATAEMPAEPEAVPGMPALAILMEVFEKHRMDSVIVSIYRILDISKYSRESRMPGNFLISDDAGASSAARGAGRPGY